MTTVHFACLLAAKMKVDNLRKLAQIIIIRHGEKEKDDAVHLDGAGMVRAANLPEFLLDSESPWKRPDVIYAMKQKQAYSSRRPLETVLPLAKRLGLNVNEGKQRNNTDPRSTCFRRA